MTASSQVTVLVGAQWGDEGKGKWIDVLAADGDLVVRYQGGNNAGHTLYVSGKKVVLHQLPSGIFHSRQTSALAAGVVINPAQLVAEISKVRDQDVHLTPERLWLSGRAHVITPWHIHVDEQRESRSKSAIGTTKRGIGPTYGDKAARSGLRVGDYVDKAARGRWIQRMKEVEPSFGPLLTTSADAWAAFEAAADALKPFVCDAESRIRAAARAGKKVLLEGAQGALLDLDHGTYPFVTSSSTGAGGACQSIGLPPRQIDRVIGIAKGYVTRVGAGPFPTELHDEVGALIAKKGQEFGATTGRPRRVGWLDGVALRYVVQVNGLDAVVLNKMDILTGLPEVKMCVAYHHPVLGELTELPWSSDVLAACEPVYQTFPGWSTEIPKSGSMAQLPPEAKAFVAAAEAFCGAQITMVGTGPGRDDALYRG
ncbi:MAG: adenylosuccinate synthase [Proteobacteria bacterium]|nr:adenylosuccinate synthase [Pseudomonadota bacterium]